MVTVRRPRCRQPVLPLSSGWYWLLAVTGLAGSAVLLGGLGPFLGWPEGSLEPLRLALVAAAVLWLPIHLPWTALVLAGVAALRVAWLALWQPERLAALTAHPWAAGAAAEVAQVLHALWLGSYEGLPPSLRVAGTLLVAGVHVVLVYTGARRPRLALVPAVTGGLVLVLAWFYGAFPRPDRWVTGYLVLAFAYAALARAAAPLVIAPPRAPRRRLPARRRLPGPGAPAGIPATWRAAGGWTAAAVAARPVPTRLAGPVALQGTALLLVAALLAGALPARNDPAVDWVPVTRLANRLLPFTIADRAGGWGAIPGARGAGVSDRQFLGGPFFTDDTPLLTVTVSGPDVPATLYLRGATRLFYDGRSWGAPNDRPALSPWGEALQGVTRGLRPDAAAGRRGRVILQRITPHVPVRPFLYALPEPRAVNGRPPVPGRPPLATEGDVIRTVDDTLLSLGPSVAEPYTVRSWVPEVDPDAAREAGRALARHRGILADPRLQPYLQLPPSLPQRVRDLAREITAGADNPYDRARAIERYLRRFPYDPAMPFTPPERDFVDYFLFDLQRGYCVAFASAAVVMLRSVGLPARWVEGFVVPTGGRPGTYTVTHAQAHAWPEVLIPGYGWIPLEPTPAYSEAPLVPAPPAPAGTVSGGGEEPARPPVPSPRPRPTGTPPVPPGDSRPAGESGRPAREAAQGGVALAVAGAGLMAGLAWVAVRRRRRGGLPPDPVTAVRVVFSRAESLLARLGYGRPPAMTAREYARWLATRLPDLAPAWDRLTGLYELARYGPVTAAGDTGAPPHGSMASPRREPAPAAAPGPRRRQAPTTAAGPRRAAGGQPPAAVVPQPSGRDQDPAGGDPGPAAGAPTPAGTAAFLPAVTLEEVQALQGEIHRGLRRVFRWRYLRVRLLPDVAAWAEAAARSARLARARRPAWTRRWPWTRMSGEGRSLGFPR